MLHLQTAAVVILASGRCADPDLCRQADPGRRSGFDPAFVCAGAAGGPDGPLPYSARRRRPGRSVLLVGALGGASYVSYSRALDFMHELPKYKARIQALGAKFREQAEQIQQTTETVLPSERPRQEDRHRKAVKHLDRPGQQECQLGLGAGAGAHVHPLPGVFYAELAGPRAIGVGDALQHGEPQLGLRDAGPDCAHDPLVHRGQLHHRRLPQRLQHGDVWR